jgi:hypothetical protein
LLIQGSIQSLPAGANRARWQEQMLANAAVWREFTLPGELRLAAEELAKSKYNQRAYNERR